MSRYAVSRGPRQDLTGQRFGKKLVVGFSHIEERPGSKTFKSFWKVKCDCGREKVIERHSLIYSGDGCGCVRLSSITKHGETWLREAVSTSRYSAGQRGLSWNIDQETFRRLCMLPCTYCHYFPPPLPGSGMKRRARNGLDRVDNNLGYEPDNVVPCCRFCNTARRNATVEDFLAWARRVVAFQKKSKVTA